MRTVAPAPEPPSHEITPESVYLRRREFIKNGARMLGTAAGRRRGSDLAGPRRAGARCARDCAAASDCQPPGRGADLPRTRRTADPISIGHDLQQLLRVRDWTKTSPRAMRTRW